MAGKDKSKPAKTPHSGRRGNPVSLAPLTPDQAMSGILAINPAELKAMETAAGLKRPAAKAKPPGKAKPKK